MPDDETVDPHEAALAALRELRRHLGALELPVLGSPSTLAKAHAKPLKAVEDSIELHRDQHARRAAG